MTLQLNQGQELAKASVLQFLMSDDPYFCLSGPAGVGKTFMLRYVMDTVMKEYQELCKLLDVPMQIFEVQLTATTNKAAEVLAESTGYPTSTIHSYIGLRVFDDYKTGKSKISKTGSFKTIYNTLLFVDEASMVDPVLKAYIEEAMDKTSKVVYVGDHCQMAPVNEKISPVYDSPKHFVELTEPVRNADQPALMALCNQLRETVKTGIFKPIQPVEGVIDYINDKSMKQLLDTDFVNENLDARALCFTNDRVHEYNEYIRGIRNYPDTFVEGEILISNSVYTPNDKPILKVEQQVEIKEISSEPYNIDIDGTASMLVYDAVLKSGIVVRIPVDKDHYKDLIRYYADNKEWRIYYKLKNSFPDLRQKDASTVYKAQGSTYEYVILDLRNIGTCYDADQVARMLYVGASRPRQRIYLYGKLPARYAG